VNKPCQTAFKEMAKKGTGLVKVYVNQFGEVKCTHVRVDDIIVDEAECRNGGKPRQLHQRMTNVDREELKAQFPEFEEEIDRAQTGRQLVADVGRLPAGDRRRARRDRVVEVPDRSSREEGLPPGPPHDHDRRLRPARRGVAQGGRPFAIGVWSERTAGFYGISLTERIAGIQRALNKRNWQIDRNLDQYAVPTTYVDMADAKLAIQTVNRIGTVVVTKGVRPTTVTRRRTAPRSTRTATT
jgi:hypothetical protein